MRITKSLAEEIAQQLIQPRKEKIKLEEQKLSNYVTAIKLSSIPPEILKSFRNHPNWFNTGDSVRFIENGFEYNHNWFKINEKLPQENGTISANKEQLKVITNLKSGIDKSINELRSDLIKLETAIFNLRTFKAVREHFPEAAELLPAETGTKAIAVNINDVRNILKK